MPGMSDSQILNTLRTKADQIAGTIAHYEDKLERARRDLSHVNAVMALYEAGEDVAPYVDLNRVFKRGEIAKLAKSYLSEAGELTTREIAARIIADKGMDTADSVLRKTVAYRVVQALRLQWKRGKIDSPGKRNNVRTWAILESRTAP